MFAFKRLPSRFLFLAFAFLASNSQAAVAPASVNATLQQSGEVPIIVQYKQRAEQGDFFATVKTHRSNLLLKLKKHAPKNIKSLDRFGVTAMRINAEGLDAILADPNVAAVYEDKTLSPALLESTELIGATAPRVISAGGSGQVVAVLDTGVETNHPFLSGKVVQEACFSTNSSVASTVCPNNQETQYGAGAAAPCSLGSCAHGTHVAGIVAGENASYTGVAPDAKIIAIQVFSEFTADYCGGSPCALTYFSDVLRGLDYTYSLRNTYNIAAANLSIGGGSETSACDSHFLKSSVDLLLSGGIATVIAAGNDGNSSAVSEPGCISSAITVAASTKQDAVASYSNSSSLVDLIAPGSSIASSVTGGGYANYSGTSMATPHVAGAFAVLRSAYPNETVSQILTRLQNAGSDITDNRNNLTFPRIQVDLAFNTVDSERHDFNTDGKSDIFWRHSKSGANWLYSMDGPAVAGSAAMPPVSDTSWKVALIADFDGDGDADVFWRNQKSGSLWLYLMQETVIAQSFSLGTLVDQNWQVQGSGDFNGDGTDDILWRHAQTGSNWLYLMSQSGVSSSQYINTVSDLNWQVAVIGDTNADGKADIVWRNVVDGVNWIYTMNSNQVQASRYLNTVSDQSWSIRQSVDLNADGFSDLIWYHQSSGTIWAYLMDSNGVSSSQQIGVVADTKWQIIKTGDFNNDSYGDILWRHQNNGQIWLFEMQGTNISLSQSIGVVNPDWEIISR